MSIAGTYPEQGVRVALDLRNVSLETPHVHYTGEAYTPNARYALSLTIDVATGKGALEITSSRTREGNEAPPLDTADAAFVKQLGVQLWRQATSPVGTWARRVQRWRGPK